MKLEEFDRLMHNYAATHQQIGESCGAFPERSTKRDEIEADRIASLIREGVEALLKRAKDAEDFIENTDNAESFREWQSCN